MKRLTAVFQRDDEGFWLVESSKNPASTRTDAPCQKHVNTSLMRPRFGLSWIRTTWTSLKTSASQDR